MMYRPSLKSSWSLILLSVLALGLYLIAAHNYVEIKGTNYEEKVIATQLMQNYLDILKDEIEARGIEIDPINDRFQTGLIGHRLSSITTDRGLLSEKQAAINPNIAVIFVDELSRFKKGDKIAVGISGSNPAVNLALYAAITALELDPKIITSLSSASYGANREELTWLDMESILNEHKVLSFKSSFASIGGAEDLGIGLSENGIAALQAAMRRNNVPLLMGKSLNDNVMLRMYAYEQMLKPGERYQLFVNIGGSLANVGSEPNARLIPEGMNFKLAEKQFEKEGVMMKMAKNNVPVFHVRRILRWAKQYHLNMSMEHKPVVGEGSIFSTTIHNVTIAAICLAVLLAAIIIVIIFDRQDRHFMANIIDPDEEL